MGHAFDMLDDGSTAAAATSKTAAATAVKTAVVAAWQRFVARQKSP